jgi:hypothetical protein
LTTGDIKGITTNGNNIFAAKYYGGIMRSTDNGVTWTQTSYTTDECWSMASSGSNIYAGVGGGVYLSSDNGVTWNFKGLYYYIIYSLTVSGNKIFAGTHDFGLFYSSNGGANWSQTSMGSGKIYSILVSGDSVYCAQSNTNTGTGGVFFSTNNGGSWTNIFPADTSYFRSLAKNGNTLIAGTYNHGVYLTTNNGIQWFRKNQGFVGIPWNSSYIMTLLYFNNNFYAGTWGQAFWKRSSTEIVGINNISAEIPSSFKLFQNYPNPFNSISKIKYQISKIEVRSQKSEVRIVIYDITGKVVSVLVNQEQEPGTYEVTFDGSNLASGIYFYQLRSGEFVETRRFVLLK